MSQTPAEKFFWRKDPTSEEPREATTTSKQPTPAKIETIENKAKLKSTVLIGIPCHNSEGTIAKAIVRLLPLGADIVVCDDGSSDSTEEISRKMGCLIIKHPRELGRSDAVTSLFLAAKKLQAEALLTVAVDSNFNLMDATKLIDAVEKGEVDIAIGSRLDRDSIDRAHNEGQIADKGSIFRSYGKKALTLISPPGTGSVVVEKEVLEFAEQQGLKVREFPITQAAIIPVAETKQAQFDFDSRFMNYAAIKHPLVFLGIPSLGFLYVSVLKTALGTDFANFSLATLQKFALSLASSPLFIASIALSIGSAAPHSQKQIFAS